MRAKNENFCTQGKLEETEKKKKNHSFSPLVRHPLDFDLLRKGGQLSVSKNSVRLNFFEVIPAADRNHNNLFSV